MSVGWDRIPWWNDMTSYTDGCMDGLVFQPDVRDLTDAEGIGRVRLERRQEELLRPAVESIAIDAIMGVWDSEL